MLSIVPFLGIEVNITKEAPLSFSMNNFQDGVLDVMSPLSVCKTLRGGSWLCDYYDSYDGHDLHKHLRQALKLASLPAPHKYNPRERCEKIFFIRERQAERTTCKNKSLVALFLVESNTSQKVTPFHSLISQV